jgi:hypothetical protein
MSTKDKIINCGQRTIQSMYRISIRDICTAYNIKKGQKVEVWIKIVEDE